MSAVGSEGHAYRLRLLLDCLEDLGEVEVGGGQVAALHLPPTEDKTQIISHPNARGHFAMMKQGLAKTLSSFL